MRRLIAHRDARVYLFGQTLSTIGDNALWLAMGIWVKILTGSNSAAGLVFFAFAAGALLAPLTGMLADRVRRRPLLVVANLAAAALVCGLLTVHGAGQVGIVYLVMFGYGTMNGLITAAQGALLAVVLPTELLGDANAALQMASQGLRIFTPLLGAGLLALVGPVPVVLLDVASFVAAAGAVAALRHREPAPAPAQSHWREEITAGISHINRTPILRRLMITGIIALLVFGFFETLSFAVVSQGLHRTPEFLGVLQSLMGVGALAGGAVAGAVMRRTGERLLVVLALGVLAVACLLFTPPWLPAVLAGMAMLGVGVVWVNVGYTTAMQRWTPPELLGRVESALTVAITAPQTVSIAVGAALVALVEYRVLLVVMALVIVAAGGYLMRGGEEAVPSREALAPAPEALPEAE